MDTGDTAFVLLSASLVLFMTPGLALFYGGMVRAKNVLSTIMQSVFAAGVITVVWVLAGYTLAFGSATGPLGGFIGGLEHLGFSGILGQVTGTIPTGAFAIYQCMFAVITPALITGAFAERMKFRAWALLSVLWVLVVYAPVAHWVWGGGWMAAMGVKDFAGGIVVHATSGAAALVAAIMLGRRLGHGTSEIAPHNLTMTLLGAGILWFGWFGFNAGSALAANEQAVSAFIATHVAAAAGMLAWLAAERYHSGRATTLGAATGAVAGLATVTPASGFVTPLSALLIGTVAGVVCYGAVLLKNRFGYDDSLDVVGVHGVGGVLGSLMIALLAAKSVGGVSGLIEGNTSLVIPQLVGVTVAVAYSLTATWAILKVIDLTVGLRVDEDIEISGLDLAEHAEVGYSL
ncbi:MAG: ammonia channel protein [Actinobacteria bacterium HGW-Actinobacteria-7]|nr:MAG: ammonia channel protein [Actinobacteria bacterium HGW-Actinobacteria-7]